MAKFSKSMAEPNSPMEIGIKVGTAAVATLLTTAIGWGAGKFFGWVDEKKAEKQRKKEEEAKKSLSEEEILRRAEEILEKREKSGKTGDLTAQ